MPFPRFKNDPNQLVIDALMAHSDMTAGELSKATGIMMGSLYPVLIDLERRKRIISVWESPTPRPLGPPRRRFYRIPAADVRR